MAPISEATEESKSPWAGPLDRMWQSVEAVPELQHDLCSETKLGNYDLLQFLGEGQ